MMKKQNIPISFVLCIALLLCAVFGASAQAAEDEYIPLHSLEELTALSNRVREYMQENGETVAKALDETEDAVISEALAKGLAAAELDDPTPEQIDNAYAALYNMFLFTGLIVEPNETFTSETIFQLAVQLIDQSYYDLMAEAGESAENIEYAAYLRDIAEAIVEDPESFTQEEVESWLLDIYQETYLAAGLKTMYYAGKLPSVDELYGQNDTAAAGEISTAPDVTYETAEPLKKLLGIDMPDLTEAADCKLGYYSIIAETVAEAEFILPDESIVLFRLCPEPGYDISGVQSAEYYETWNRYSTDFDVYKYGKIWVAFGDIQTLDETKYSFAVDAENVTAEQFDEIVTFFIEACRNQRTAK